MVVGGGIAGIQASLDLAEIGVEVFLVEHKPSIGGRMAQLDKTFPTNDCAMCILSPKLVEAGSNKNIHIIANADVQSVEGEAGNFLRRLALPKKIRDWSLRTLQVKLIKIGAKVIKHSGYVIFQMAEVMLSRSLFYDILERIGRLKPMPIGYG
jgi:heterodisulfide reductase subunit A-like polyferredoxin